MTPSSPLSRRVEAPKRGAAPSKPTKEQQPKAGKANGKPAATAPAPTAAPAPAPKPASTKPATAPVKQPENDDDDDYVEGMAQFVSKQKKVVRK